jgi:hypothetical protein
MTTSAAMTILGPTISEAEAQRARAEFLDAQLQATQACVRQMAERLERLEAAELLLDEIAREAASASHQVADARAAVVLADIAARALRNAA